MVQTKLRYKKTILFTAVALLSAAIPVKAEEITISGNGGSSSNSVEVSAQNTTTVNQTNSAEISNTVQTNANTGNNTASENTNGNTTVNTGSVQANVSVTNEANSNVVDTSDCCNQTTGQTVISGNGSASENAVTVASTNTTTITNSNTTTITNNISGTVNTGNNSGNFNTNGDVSIKTGNISVEQKIENGPINGNNISVHNSNVQGNQSVKISGNGAFSTNTANVDNKSNTNISVENTANILNESLWFLNTGNNNANYNNGGNVSIETGSISFISKIINGPINFNVVKVSCGCTPEEHKPPTGGVTPETPTSNTPSGSSTGSSASSGSSSGQGGSVQAAVESLLPETGNYTFVLFLIGNVMMFLIGVVLRLRSGRSPGFSPVL